MEKTLEKFGFIKNGLYSWSNEPFHVSIYFDGLTITQIEDDKSSVLYDGVIPKNEKDEIELIEHYTKLKIVNKYVEELLDSTKSTRIFSNTSLYISNLLINYFKYNGETEEDVCKKLNIDKNTLKLYLTGSYDFKLSEISNISVLVGKVIYIK
ncbi:MAG: hypothetical protein HPY57_14370 [Ignavibacteria bacterium]|nr:hypothetical protein [Ignavibacteria bacterium]